MYYYFTYVGTLGKCLSVSPLFFSSRISPRPLLEKDLLDPSENAWFALDSTQILKEGMGIISMCFVE